MTALYTGQMPNSQENERSEAERERQAFLTRIHELENDLHFEANSTEGEHNASKISVLSDRLQALVNYVNDIVDPEDFLDEHDKLDGDLQAIESDINKITMGKYDETGQKALDFEQAPIGINEAETGLEESHGESRVEKRYDALMAEVESLKQQLDSMISDVPASSINPDARKFKKAKDALEQLDKDLPYRPVDNSEQRIADLERKANDVRDLLSNLMR